MKKFFGIIAKGFVGLIAAVFVFNALTDEDGASSKKPEAKKIATVDDCFKNTVDGWITVQSKAKLMTKDRMRNPKSFEQIQVGRITGSDDKIGLKFRGQNGFGGYGVDQANYKVHAVNGECHLTPA